MQKRAELYAAAHPMFPDSHFVTSDRWISATWFCGNNYKSLSKRSADDQPFYGSYPPGYLKRIWTMFGDCDRILHLFSGSLTIDQARPPWPAFVLRMDSNDARQPDVVTNAESFADQMPEHLQGTFQLILADPPYSMEDAEHYGVPLCNKKKVLEQCHKALIPGGLLLWMDQALPMYSKEKWKLVGTISIFRSTNHRIRAVMFFQKQ